MIYERDIEMAVCRYAKKKGWLAYKFTSPSRRSVPDRILLQPGGRAIFIEFKRPGGKPTKNQLREINRIIDQEFLAVIVDSVEQGKLLIDMLEKSC